MSDFDHKMLARSIALARDNVRNGGGPFGAVITRDGVIVGEAVNQVIVTPDPTAHAEVQAIRLAASKLGTFDLSGCTLYSSCEPCPMCLGAVYWSRISRVVFASDRSDAAKAGFRDATLYHEMALDPARRTIPFDRINLPDSGKEFDDWLHSNNRISY
ncbi:MAG: nucleoside deaminase [Bacteroidota bacterium]